MSVVTSRKRAFIHGLLDPATGEISGTPTRAGLYSKVIIEVIDGAQWVSSTEISFQIVTVLSITTTLLPDGVLNVDYAEQLAVSEPCLCAWRIASGVLPPGLSLNPTTGRIWGVPLPPANTHEFEVQVTDDQERSASRRFRVTITTLAVLTRSLPNALLGAFYMHAVAVSGGRLPYRWQVTQGALPSGLTLSSAGVITGTPAAAGQFAFRVKVTDDAGNSCEAALTLLVEQPAPVLAIATVALPDGRAGTPYSQALAASGGKSPYSFSIRSGALPPGLTLGADGRITGTPAEPGGFAFTVQAADSAGAKCSRAFTLQVAMPEVLPVINAVVNAASYRPGVSPHAWVAIFGRNLAPIAAPGRTWREAEIVDGKLPTALDGVSVRIAGQAAPIYFVGPDQLNVLTPEDLSPGIVSVEVTTPAGAARVLAVLTEFAPALFSENDASGRSCPAAVHADGTRLTSRAARPGDMILFFGTGFGPTSPARRAGELAEPAPLSTVFTVWIGGREAGVLYGGLVGPGLYQFNVQVPELPEGYHVVTVTIAGSQTQREVYLPVGR